MGEITGDYEIFNHMSSQEQIYFFVVATYFEGNPKEILSIYVEGDEFGRKTYFTIQIGKLPEHLYSAVYSTPARAFHYLMQDIDKVVEEGKRICDGLPLSA